ncbi:MAG: phosphatidate cytidylyltransferase [Solirubrobacterales bacterium]
MEGSNAKRGLGDLPARIAIALPAGAVVAGAVALGGWPFAAVLAIAAGLAAVEGARLFAVEGWCALAVGLGAVGLVVVAEAEGRAALVPATLAGCGLVAVAAVRAMPDGARARTAAAGALLVVWVGGGLAHGALLRELPHGAGLVVAILLGTFLGDTAAHIGGTLAGRRPLAPRVSPNKTMEGLALGIAFGTASVVVFGVAFTDWLDAADAALLGLAVAIAAPLGDLFESAVKRDAGVKDSGSLLGPHGGMLDRVDAVLVTAPTGFYAALALL